MPSFDPPVTLAEALQPLSRDTIAAKMYSIYDTLGVDRSHWITGYVMDAFTVGASIILSGLSNLMAEIGKGAYLDTASTNWLRLKAYYDYGIKYNAAAPAQGTIQVYNGSLAALVANNSDLIVENATTGKKYRIAAAVSQSVGTTVTYPVIAIESGSDSNAVVGQITSWVTPVATGITVTNTTNVIGSDDESNQALAQRCRESVALWSPNNPTGSYAARLKTVLRDDGSAVGVTRVRPLPDGYGNVVCYVASDTGGFSSPDIATLQAAVVQTVEPLGVNATVASASELDIALSGTIYCTGNAASADVLTAINAAVIAFQKLQNIGGARVSGVGYVFKNALIRAIMDAHPAIVTVSLSSPSGDTVLTPNQFPVFTPSTLTVLTSVS